MEIVTIGNDDTLLRRFPIGNPSYIEPDGSITSFAYHRRKVDTDGLSVDLEKLTTTKKSVVDATQYGLLRIKAGSVRAIDNLDCVHAPVAGNDAHSLITGDITKDVKRKLIAASQRIPQAELV